jgi:hypothetical protein
LTSYKKYAIIKARDKKGSKKMITYTEAELKSWFLKEVKKYPNSNTEQHLKAVYHLMFNKDSTDNLKEMLDKE